MLRKIFIALIFTFILQNFSLASNNEIWITPNSNEYTRLSTGLAGSNISIIDETILKENYNNFSRTDCF